MMNIENKIDKKANLLYPSLNVRRSPETQMHFKIRFTTRKTIGAVKIFGEICDSFKKRKKFNYQNNEYKSCHHKSPSF
jgi:hypothetical protein